MQMRFETASRYYVARLDRDLFNTWIVQIAHGGKSNNLGKIITKPVASEKEGIQALADISVRRVKRKYTRCSM